MKQGFKLLVVLLMTLLLTISATAQINWLKQDGNVKYLAWDNGSNSKTIYNGNSAAFTTGYFGSTISQTVKLTVTINNKNDGQIVSTLVSKNVNVANTLGYEIITVLPEHYKNKAGEYIIVIKIKDANTEVVDSSLYLKVKPILIINIPPLNHAPVIDDLDNKEVKENQNLQFTISANDADNDDLTFEASVCLKLGNNCLWFPVGIVGVFGVSFNEETDAFSWTPGYDFVKHPSLSRSIDFKFRAVDEHDKKSAWEQVTVNVRDTNRRPQLGPIGNKIVQEEQLLKFTVNAVDLDHDGLTYSIQGGLPSGAVFNAGTHQFKWVPTNTQAGLYLLTFKVVDGFGGKDTKSIVIQVTDLPVQEPQCDDGLDNDGDGKIDYHADPGCSDQEDNDETDEPVEQPQCKDGIDNDNDGKIDFPADPGCSSQDDDDENDPVDVPECIDGIDNDGDGKIDYPADPGCSNGDDDNESDDPLPPQCADVHDNDGDGKIDFPADPGCTDQEDNDETNEIDDPEDLPQCSDGIDNDNDALPDLHDPGCSDGNDDDETDEPVEQPQCNDGQDNDRDGKIDFPADPGCTDQEDNDETDEIDDPEDLPKCNDGIDNDNDTLIDLHDPGCSDENDDDETDANEPPQPQPASYTNIKFKTAHIEDMIVHAGELMAVHVHIFNNGKTDLKDVEVQATIYEIGAFGSTSDFNLPKGKGAMKSIFVPVPEEAQPGWYLVKITAKNYHYHTSTYRLAYIANNTFQ
ncbi:MAG: Ig-like domain-containing protein [Nanoarchaeota archaeon]|nr:Ig-like domain-containing protein [Nanoarchaeota archaeon]